MSFSNNKTPEEDGFLEFSKYFKLIKCIGGGGFGKVVLAVDLSNGETYAVKVKLPNNFININLSVLKLEGSINR